MSNDILDPNDDPLAGTSPERKKRSKRFDPPIIPPNMPRKSPEQPQGPERILDHDYTLSPDGRPFIRIGVREGAKFDVVAVLPAQQAFLFASNILQMALTADMLADLLKYFQTQGLDYLTAQHKLGEFTRFQAMMLAQQQAMQQAAQHKAEQTEEDAG